MMKKTTIKIKGMSCSGCENIVKEAILHLGGIKNLKVSHVDGTAVLEFDPAKTNVINIMDAISNAGYKPELA
jgi:copper chaperone CopZ